MSEVPTYAGAGSRRAVRVAAALAATFLLTVGARLSRGGAAVASDAPAAGGVIVTGSVRVPAAWDVRTVHLTADSINRPSPADLRADLEVDWRTGTARFGGWVQAEEAYVIDIEPMGFRLLRHVTRQQAFLEIDVPPPAPITVHVINGQTGAGLPGAAVFWLGEIQDVQDETIRFEELGWSQAVPTECGTEFCDSAPEGTMRVHVRRKGYVSQNLRNVRVRPRTGCHLDVRMQIAGRILVRVAGEGASRAEGHSLHVHPEPRSGRATYFFRIVGRECRVDDLEAGTYRLWVAGPGGRPLSTPKLVSVAGGVEEVVEVEVPR